MKILKIEFCNECHHKKPYGNTWMCVWNDMIIGQLFEAMQPWCVLEDDRQQCEWTNDNPNDDGSWLTGCGKEMYYNEGTPDFQFVPYCPCCGKKIKTKEEQDGTFKKNYDGERT